MKCRKYELALKDYEEVLRTRPEQYLGYIGIAKVYEEQKQYKLALINYEKATKICNSVEIVQKRGICYCKNKCYEEGFKDLSFCDSLDYMSAESYLYLGKIYSKKSDVSNAVICLE